MDQFGHCCYYAQREEQNWCILKRAVIAAEDYQKYCSFEAEGRCPLRQDLTFSEQARRRSAARRQMPEG